MNAASILDSFLLSEYPYLIFQMFIFLEFRNKPLSPPHFHAQGELSSFVCQYYLGGESMSRSRQSFLAVILLKDPLVWRKRGLFSCLHRLLSLSPLFQNLSLYPAGASLHGDTQPHQKTHALKLEQPPFDPPLWNSFLAVRHWETLLTKYPQFLLLLMENRDKNNPIFRTVVWLRRDDVYGNF